MPDVQSQVRIPGLRRDVVWRILRDFESYPAFMDDVLEVTVRRRADGSEESDWRVLLNGSELTWTEVDHFEDGRRIVFSQVDGDLEVWNGVWAVEQQGPDVVVSLDVTFDIGIPSLADVLNPIGVRAIHNNTNQMLAAIRDLAVERAAT